MLYCSTRTHRNQSKRDDDHIADSVPTDARYAAVDTGEENTGWSRGACQACLFVAHFVIFIFSFSSLNAKSCTDSCGVVWICRVSCVVCGVQVQDEDGQPLAGAVVEAAPHR